MPRPPRSVTLRFDAQAAELNRSMLLHSYWQDSGFHRPRSGIYMIAQGGNYRHLMALLDSGSDFIAFDQDAAEKLGLSPPFPRSTTTQGAAPDSFGLSFPA